MIIRGYREEDIPAMTAIWNEVVEEGIAFPQEEFLEEETGAAFSESRAIAGLRSRKKGEKYWAYIFCIRITWEDAGTYAMRAMPWLREAEACISGKSWCWTASNRRGASGFGFYSSMRSSRRIFMPDICMRESGLHS